ncbi:universal stress protein [Halegenticoccus tardaugens]|uniref:universal stress protein n=1 Tax=Halegenticoccus tardaugens TaxID=2071624 RepID=UPI00100A2354|nr:HPP family protein [Halegenticoccus tardaugens]
MLDRLEARATDLLRRLRRLERREVAEFRRWAENTNNLLHLMILFVVPPLIALVTLLANALEELSFLLFPPLAAGAYTLFADPEGRYASPWKFVAGLTLGAACGWLAEILVGTAAAGLADGTAIVAGVSPLSAAVSVFLTGGLTWAFGVEEPAAFSTALLVLLTDTADPGAYVASVALSGAFVAAAFTVWRSRIYQRRARYLYGTIQGDDHVLVPVRGGAAEITALFGARLAAAHEAGKVVLLGLVDADDPPVEEETTRRAAATVASELEARASTIRTRVGVPCEVVVASGDPGTAAVRTATRTNCDLVVTPYEEERGLLADSVRAVFAGPTDAVAFRSSTGKRRWRRILVTVSRPGDSAHAMIDFATRLAGPAGTVSVCTCIDREVERRPAERRLANLVETVGENVETAGGNVETRVARATIEAFIGANAGSYDLLILGSSRDRSAASRFVSPPTFERLRDVECDVAVVDRGRRPGGS